MSIALRKGHTYVIAEAGVNHDGDVHRALSLIEVAKDAGADAVKFQYFRPEELASSVARKAEYQEKNEGRDSTEESQQEMLERLTLTHDEYKQLKDKTESLGMDFITTPFDLEPAKFLASLGVKALKIPSGEVTNLAFLEGVAELGIFTIISTGMCNLEEIAEAVALFDARKTPYALLHCVSSYPAPDDQINLRAMKTMRDAFKVPVGYSDHTTGIEATLAAVTLGAEIIEKHFTYDKTAAGPDHAASLEPGELKTMMQGVRLIDSMLATGELQDVSDEEKIERVFSSPALKAMVDRARVDASLGNSEKKCQPCEVDVLRMGRRSCQLNVAVKEGETITRDMLTVTRPADDGLPPKRLESLVGKKATRDLDAYVPLMEGNIA